MSRTIEELEAADRRASWRGPWQEERLAAVLSLLVEVGIEPEPRQEQTLRWLCGGDLHSVANVVDLILTARRGAHRFELIVDGRRFTQSVVRPYLTTDPDPDPDTEGDTPS